jgi:hypothetical protein
MTQQDCRTCGNLPSAATNGFPNFPVALQAIAAFVAQMRNRRNPSAVAKTEIGFGHFSNEALKVTDFPV